MIFGIALKILAPVDPSAVCSLGRMPSATGKLTNSEHTSANFKSASPVMTWSASRTIRSLRFSFVADLRPAENDGRLRAHPLDGGDDFSGLGDVPDVNTQADDLWILRQQDFRDVHRTLVDVEFHDPRARLQVAEVREEVAQAERGMDELRVERGKDDVRHGNKV